MNASHKTTNRSTTLIRTIGLGSVILWVTTAAAQAQLETPKIRVNVTTRLDSVGGAHVEASTRFEPAKMYDNIKASMPNLYVLFRDVIGNYRSAMEVDRNSVKIVADDNNRVINFSANYIGAATLKDDTWRGQLDRREEVISSDNEKVITQMISVPPNGWLQNGTAIYYYPAGAQGQKVDRERFQMTYRLPKPTVVARAAGKPQVDIVVRCKKKVMSSLYKIYSDQQAQNGLYWVAKTIIKNTGAAPIYDLKVTYRLGEYADATAAHTYSSVLPKGAAVDLYYPFLSAKVAQFKTRTPAQLITTCQYKDAAGKTYSEELTDTLDILGINQFEFSNLVAADRVAGFFDNSNNAPLLSAYVTKMDDPVKMFAGWISEASGGAGASLTDEDANKWMRAAYNMELENNIVYQTPSSEPSSESFSQDIKYPRDVLRAKSGTCVDLAILYAALAESVGLKSHLMLIPGHCFCVVRLPKSGNFVCVENTGLAGGNVRMTFDQATQRGKDEFEENMKKGIFYLINVEETQDRGRVPSPELPTLESDFLEKCGLHRHVGRIGGAPPNAGVGTQLPNPGPAPNPPPAGASRDTGNLTGRWEGNLGLWKLNLQIQQDGDLASGTVIVQSGIAVMRGSFRKANVSKDNSIKIVAVVEGNGGKLSVTLDGVKKGGYLEGSAALIERNLLGIKVRESNVSWSAARAN